MEQFYDRYDNFAKVYNGRVLRVVSYRSPRFVLKPGLTLRDTWFIPEQYDAYMANRENIISKYKSYAPKPTTPDPIQMFLPMFNLEHNLSPSALASQSIVESIPTSEENDRIDSLIRSLRRSRSMITDITLANSFTHFGTLTLNPSRKNVSRFRYKVTDVSDDSLVKSRVRGFLKATTRKYPGFSYLVVPERHKSGVLHFHCVVSGLPEDSFVFSGHYDKKARPIFNLSQYDLGHSNFTVIGDYIATARYLQKYVTKDLSIEPGVRRYWVSRNVKKPQKLYNVDFIQKGLVDPERKFSTDRFDLYYTDFPLDISDSR